MEEVQKLLYPELSYQLVGILFCVHNELPSGYQEKHVQRAIATTFNKAGIKFKQQVMVMMEFERKVIGRYFLDFLIEDKIILEIKVGEKLSKKDFDQVKQYLQKTGLKLGLLARFGSKGVKTYRILCPTN